MTISFIKSILFRSLKEGFFATVISTFLPFKILYILINFKTKGQYLRAICYHDVPARYAHKFEKHLQFFSRYFSSVSFEDFEIYMNNKKWHKNKPGLIITFDDGLRTAFDIVKPLLEKWGFSGWFSIPSEFPDILPDNQVEYAEQHRIDFEQSFKDGRIALSREEIKALDRNHVIICHTHTHIRLPLTVKAEILENEIMAAKVKLEQIVNHTISIFGWVGGEEINYSSEAAKIVRKSGFKYAFITKPSLITKNADRYILSRTSFKPYWDLPLVRHNLSSILDIIYSRQIRRIYKILKSH